jgi:hypothetical protein
VTAERRFGRDRRGASVRTPRSRPTADEVDEAVGRLELRCVPTIGQLDVLPVRSTACDRAGERDRDQAILTAVHHHDGHGERVEVDAHSGHEVAKERSTTVGVGAGGLGVVVAFRREFHEPDS